MKRLLFFCVALLMGIPVFSHNTAVKQPVEYVRNEGQWEGNFHFRGTTPNGNIYLMPGGFRIVQLETAFHDIRQRLHNDPKALNDVFKYHVYDMAFVGANLQANLKTDKPQTHYYNYFLGQDPARWKTGIHPVLAVDYVNLYQGIDAHIYSENGHIKYDLLVSAGADAQQIEIAYAGIEGIKLDKGVLKIKTSVGENTELAPYAYQWVDGNKIEVPCQYELRNEHVRFRFPKGYNKQASLVIDPVLIFSTLTGSSADNWGFTATYDTTGNFYSGGIANNVPANFPTTPGAFQSTYGGSGISGGGFGCDASISKFNTVGNTLLYSTYLGGIDNDQPHSMVVSPSGELVVVGRTYSSNFPVSAGCFDNSYNGAGDMFVTRFNSTGTAILGSTYIGGSGADGENISPIYTNLLSLKHNYGDDARSEVILDDAGNILVAASTSSANFPVVAANQATLAGQQDGVIFVFNPVCSNLFWSTFWGGSQNDACYALTFDKSNSTILYVAGGTESSNFPVTPGTLHPNYMGGIDGFLLRFNYSTLGLVAGTFIGTNAYDQVYGVQTDDSNRVYVMGQTMGAYPVTAGVYSNPNSPQFITALNSNLNTILFSTVYGSGSTATTNISPVAFLVDKCGSVYVSGWGGPTGGNPGTTFNMPITPGAIQSTTDGSDFYFIVLSKFFQNLLYGSYFGQNGGGGEHVDGGTSRFDPDGVIYQAICAACGGSQIYPTTPGAYSTTNGSANCNLGSLKIDFQLQNPNAQASVVGPTTGCAPLNVVFVNNSTSATNYLWQFGDGNTSTQTAPSHIYTTAGTYTCSLIASNPNGCTASSDTAFIVIVIKADSIFPAFTVTKVDSCGPFTINIANNSTHVPGSITPGTTFVWDFGDGTSFTGANPPLHNYPGASTYTITLTMIDTTACNNPQTVTQVIDFTANVVTAAFACPDSVCMPALINFTDQSSNATTWAWTFGDGGTSSTANPSHPYAGVGTYTVYLTTGNPNTCNLTDTATKVITIFPSPVADFSWFPNPPQPNTPNSFTNLSVGATQYLWDFGDGTSDTTKNPVHVYDKDGTYNVCLTVTNQYGCIDTTCKPVRGIVIPLVDVPTGFSPNGDGKNDVVYVKGYGIDKMLFRIYNRWGEKVFESTRKQDGWNGIYKGTLQEMDVFAYTLDVTFFDGSKAFKKGNITLLK